ncbi:hypothetical protein OIDMADRAFT_135669, partial [Oidiodendron maius Zn]
LASVLRYQKRCDEAEKRSQRALEGREKELGMPHSSTLTSVHNRTVVLVHQGKYKEAENLD